MVAVELVQGGQGPACLQGLGRGHLALGLARQQRRHCSMGSRLQCGSPPAPRSLGALHSGL